MCNLELGMWNVECVRAGASADRPFFDLDCPGGADGCAPMRGSGGRRSACQRLSGVISYVVAQRTREIGVRMALGATRSQLLAMMFWQAGTMTLVGIGTGIAGALVLTRSMSSLLFGVSAADPAIYIGVSLILAIVACLAVAVPSSRATRVDPLAALRDS